jgi:hypothetical protein
MLPSRLAETFPFLTDQMYWAGFGSALVVVVVLRAIWWAIGKLTTRPEPDLTPPPIKAASPPPEQADNWEFGLPPPEPHERRNQLRRGGNPVPVLYRGPDAQPVQAYVLDRSRGGLRLLVPRAVEVGTRVKVRAPNAPTDIPWIEANVVWCAEGAGKLQIGLEFVAVPPWNVLLLFG